ncbi:thiamine pyrophosphate-dependent enzyme [Stackebrandtia soli]|uniref:thiamine pyrophosphate-dependent enzyme n=1 Tax=Stackebrandtia soli TaxID=1892856 RepID=UPI0039EC81CA
MPTTVSQTLVDGLVACGVPHVFGVVGDALNSVTDAIRRTAGISWIGTRHEEVAAFAAGASAQLTGRLGVCAGTVGPGGVHLLNGLYDAAKSHAPVLAVVGQVPLSEMGSNYFQEIDNDRLFSDVAVYCHTITSESQVPRVFEQAIAAAMAKRGVAVVSLPGDIGPRTVSDERTITAFTGVSTTVPAAVHLDRAATLINAADRVTILAGIGASAARSPVIALAKHLSAPIVVTLKGKETFDWDNPYQVGQTGLIGNPAAASALRRADLLIMVGTDFPYRDWYPDEARVIQIETVADHIGRRVGVDVGLVGDAGETIDALLSRIHGNANTEHLPKAQEEYASWRRGQAKLAHPDYDSTLVGRVRGGVDNPGDLIRPEAVAAAVSELADDDAVFTVDTGMCAVWLARFVDFTQGRRLIGSFNLGSMANAMPQALGAAACDPSRQVIAFCGDGGLTMLMGDLLTAVAHDLPVKLVVFDNHRLGMVKLEQEEAGLPEFGTVLDNPDLAAIARATGMSGVRITEPERLREQLAEALAEPGPVLIDVLTNPEEISVPPKPKPGQAWGFAIARLKETIRSRD